MRFLHLSLGFCAAAAVSLGGCASVTDKIPVVKIERKTPKRVVVQEASYSQPNVQRAEAAMVCDNDNMRARAADKNRKNDTARVLIMEEGTRRSQVIADIEVNCRDYFANQRASLTPASTRRIINATAPIDYGNVPVPAPKPAPKAAAAASGLFYAVRRGDTLYEIARDHCTSVKAIARLNNISDPTQIGIDQILRLPSNICNTRN